MYCLFELKNKYPHLIEINKTNKNFYSIFVYFFFDKELQISGYKVDFFLIFFRCLKVRHDMFVVHLNTI
jgi:hypothetical protein